MRAASFAQRLPKALPHTIKDNRFRQEMELLPEEQEHGLDYSKTFIVHNTSLYPGRISPL